MEPTIVADLCAPSPVGKRIHLVSRLKRLDVFHQWPGLSDACRFALGLASYAVEETLIILWKTSTAFVLQMT